MTVAEPLALTLVQRKVFTGYAPRTARFAVQNQVTASADGDLAVASAFVMGPATGVDRERLVRVLDLTNAADVALPVNPLRYFKDLAVDVSAVSDPAVLRITTPPGEWDVDGSLPNTIDYEIESIDTDNARLVLSEPFWWSAQYLTWEILDAAETSVLASGTAGYTEREQPDAVVMPLWRVDRVTAAFDDAAAAQEHIVAMQAYIRSLSAQANVDPSVFLAMAPGNPITNVY